MDDEDRNEIWGKLCTRSAELSVHYGLFSSVVNQFPEYVQHNFNERMLQDIKYLEMRVKELHAFAESYDDDAAG